MCEMMKAKKNNHHFSFLLMPFFIGIALFCFHSYTIAAPGELSGLPLSLVTSTKPNILLLLDDSGSMDAQNVITVAAQNTHGDLIDGVGGENRSIIETDKALLRLCAGYNALAFNPKIKYEKWRDYDGNIFDDKQSDNLGGSVLENPLDATGIVDLSDDIYIRWDDADNDGEYDVFYLDDDGKFDGECGPDFTEYDSQAVIALPSTGTISSGADTGILTDSNSHPGNDSNYRAIDAGILHINVAGGGDVTSGDFITFEIIFFNVDISDNDTDSLTVYGGEPGSPIVGAVYSKRVV